MAKKTPEEKAAEAERKALEKEQRIAEYDPEDEPAETGVDDTGAEQPDKDAPRDERGVKLFRHPVREAVFKKSTGDRARRKEADTKDLDDDGRRLQEAMEAEVRGEANEFDTEAGAGDDVKPATSDKETPPKKKPEKTVDSEGDLVTIRIDGKEQQVPRSEVEQAGIATLQKERTGDESLRRARQYEESVRSLETRVREELEKLTAKTQAGEDVTGDDGKATPPDSGAVAKAIEESAAGVAEAIYGGDQEKVKESLTALMTSVAQGRAGSTPPLDAKQIAGIVITQIREQQDADRQAETAEEHRRTAESVNTAFKDEFTDLYDDDRAFRLTKAEFERLCEQKPTADRVELMREAGTAITELLNPPETPETELERRRLDKRSKPAKPASGTRAPAEPTAPKRKTGKQVVAEMRQSRGQLMG